MLRALLTLAFAFSLSGCALQNWMFPPADFSPRAPCRLPPSVTKEQLVQHLNKNIQGSATTSGIASWRSTNVKITATGLPPGISVPASIAVEAPRNFRLLVSEPLTRGEALDMGSNLGHFWFWAKDAEPQRVITVSHEDMPSAQRNLRVPFHPDWLMEVLGVIPIDPAKFTLRAGQTREPTLELVSDALSAGGEPQRKVIRVDGCHGIIREHALYDGHGVLIARAALADHRIDRATGLVVPHVISFDWPAMQQQMTMTIGSVELNPQNMSQQMWQIPNKNCPRLDLSQVMDGRQPVPPGLQGMGGPFGFAPPAGGVSYHRLENLDDQQSPPEQPVPRTRIQPMLHQQQSENSDEEPGTATFNVSGTRMSEPERPQEYSPEASQSSSVPRRRGRALWRWPFR